MEMGYMIAEWLGRRRWIHIAGWENGPLFDRSTLSILSVLEIENVQASAPITIGTVSLNPNAKQYFLSTNTCRIAPHVALTTLFLCVACSIESLGNIKHNIFSCFLCFEVKGV